MNISQHIAHQYNSFLQWILLCAASILPLSLAAWFYGGFDLSGWVAIGGFLLLAMSPLISPYLVLFFYRAREIGVHEAPDAHGLLYDVADSAGFEDPPRLFFIRSTVMMAFTVITAKGPAIVVSEALITRLKGNQFAAILAHELAHIRHVDLWILGLGDTVCRLTHMVWLIGVGALIANVTMFFMALDYGIFGGPVEPLGAIMAVFGTQYDHVAWPVVGILILMPALSALLHLGLSREREFLADKDAVAITGDHYSLIEALKHFDRDLGRWWKYLLVPGHRIAMPSLLRVAPETEERIERIKKSAKEHGAVPMESSPPVGMPSDWEEVDRNPRWHLSGIWY
jgi:heat shock protein HtpX